MKTAAPTEAADAQQQQQYASSCRLRHCFPPQPRYRGDDIPSAVTAARLRRRNLLLISSKQWKWIPSPAGLSSDGHRDPRGHTLFICSELNEEY